MRARQAVFHIATKECHLQPILQMDNLLGYAGLLICSSFSSVTCTAQQHLKHRYHTHILGDYKAFT